MAATAAVDVGWLKTDPVLEFLDVDSSATYHASQSLEALTARFDAEDPFFALNSNATPELLRMRVRNVGGTLDGLAGVIALQSDDPAFVSSNLIGSPLVHDSQVVGMIVFQDAESGTIEAVSATVIAKALPIETPSWFPK